jgi:ribosomal protein L10
MIKSMEESFGRQKTIYLLDYTGMKVSQAVALRKLLKKSSYDFKVVKNRLALRALKEEVPTELRSYFQKPTAVALAAAQPVKLARMLRDFSVQNKVMAFKGRLSDGLPPNAAVEDLAGPPLSDGAVVESIQRKKIGRR